MPSLIEPQLASLANRPPAGGNWSYEIKFDGYRLMVRIKDGDVALFTRNGHDWTARMPRLRDALAELSVRNAWLDGEAVVLDATGKPDFNALQNAFDRRSTADITLFIFDLLYLDDSDIREQPLRSRRAVLAELMSQTANPLLRFSEDFPQDPASVVASACKMKLEGIIGKRADAPYRSGRSADWIKLKCNRRQEFVVDRFSRPRGAGAAVDQLLLGVFEKDGSLRYAGTVQPHLKVRQATAFRKRTEALALAQSPFYNSPKPDRGREFIWLKPEIVAEVAFLEWTPGGELRHATFHAFREDKPAATVTEEAIATPQREASDEQRKTSMRERPGPRGSVILRGISISNPARVMDELSGQSKIEIVRYYDQIAEWALPWLHDRPLTLVRAPEGVGSEQFFQKHAERMRIPGVSELPTELHPGHPPLLVANSAEALVGLAQMSVVELHSWNAVAPDLEHPDRVIFDLDPDPALPWSAMLEAASLLKVVLDELGLRSFAKTSGGKGFHVVVPLTRRQGWGEVKQFSQAVAKHMARVVPERFSAVLGPKNRVRKIFIDYLRNRRGASTVAPFSVRARPGLAVSMPVSWEELRDIRGGDEWTMESALARQKGLTSDPWDGYWRTRQGITAAMRRAVQMKP
ncbi:DNA ligase D [Paraburkholderia fungorum]|jgi:bifunctional non-homologous end joining protein LigD|uniref:DNA ligase (ATP) n=1 Tax=Paraburkholderia fungorum TaxID=134537 RepID=A0AAP5QFE7_9BURK|nr:DNA ligase D [Paraburkholderia fungorum]AJZ56701.1 DNA ligase D [Paraburkholderia fungorum]MDT8842680.1 DNA ligase D [Paraburkholderia fungorum]PRZ49246.1 bifunctional non-homologous end joining protein LigD [Paraburkholderia fungorum]